MRWVDFRQGNSKKEGAEFLLRRVVLNELRWMNGLRAILFALIFCITTATVVDAKPSRSTAKPTRTGLADQLTTIRQQIISAEQGVIDTKQTQRVAHSQSKKIKTLLKLQKEEREIGRKRLGELETTISELEKRRTDLREKVNTQRVAIKKFLIQIDHSIHEEPTSLHLPEREKFEAPRRRVLAQLVDRGLKEIEVLKVDLADADQLGLKIQEEKQQLVYLFQDLREQESVLELNRQLQEDLLSKSRAERLAQLENYRKLKSAEAQVERLISDFNAHRELERIGEVERKASKAMRQGIFAKLKGKLPFPVNGKVISNFGRVYDPKSNLYIFKKGIDIHVSGQNLPVQAISDGKVAFAGELPTYGKIIVIDHGEHYYSLYAHLGQFTKQAGDAVTSGDLLGVTNDAGAPIYFEIRSRNVAVNPLQWVSN